MGLTLARDDVVKIHAGAHIDGFASVSAETLVVGATAGNPVTGPRADAIKAAWTAAEISQRLIKAGEKNWTVTDAISKIALAFGTKPVEGESYDYIRRVTLHRSLSQGCCHASNRRT